MVHKKILDVAQAQPDASLETIAEEVSGGSAEFVKRVLKEYGDPAASSPRSERADGRGSTDTETDNTSDTQSLQNGAASTSQTDADTKTDTDISESPDEKLASEKTGTSNHSQHQPDESAVAQSTKADPTEEENDTSVSDLTEKQTETLRVVQQEPAATQKEIANHLGVTRATISKRLNDISGFSWKTRREFVAELFDGSPAGTDTPDVAKRSSVTDTNELESRIEELEEQLEEATTGSQPALGPELTHKVIHSCMDAEYLSEDEELKLLRELM